MGTYTMRNRQNPLKKRKKCHQNAVKKTKKKQKMKEENFVKEKNKS